MTLWCLVACAELHHAGELRASLISYRSPSARVHCRRWRGQSLVHKQLDLDASILSTTITVSFSATGFISP